MISKLISVPTLLHLTARFYSTASKQGLTAGATTSVEKTISQKDVTLFSELSGDWNPVHHRENNSLVHGALLNGFVSGVIGSKLPGPGTLLLTETLRFPNPCYVGDTVVVTVELTEVRRLISCRFNIKSKKYKNVVMEGEAKLLVKDV
jgi:acyl dehydratase